MTIEVEIAGTGQIAEFPDGTSPEVIRRAMAGISQQAPQASPQSEPLGVGGALLGAANLANIAATKLGETAIAGVGGVLQSLNPLAPEGAGAARVQQIEQAIPDLALTQQGQDVIQAVSDKFKTTPEFVKNIVNEFVSLGPSLGERTFEATGSPLAATIAGSLPEALGAATGAGGARAAQRGIAQAVDVATEAPRQAAQVATDVFTRQSPAKQRIAELIASGSTDIDTARFRLDEPSKVEFTGEFEQPRLERVVEDPGVPGGERVVREAPPVQPSAARPRAVKDTAAINSIKQGFDEGVIADVKQASKADQSAMRRMVDIAEKSKKNKRFGVLNRPGDVAGDTLMQRLRVVQKSNRDAGRQIDKVAETLVGKRVDVTGIGDNFVNALDNMGITITGQPGGKVDIDFTGSDIEDLAGPESVIKRVVKRMSSATPPDAKELHRLKRFIDEQVTFGKNAEGLAGQTERVLKDLRRNINETLGDQFPDYREVNTQYSETIRALDAFQDVAGQKMNLTGENADKATGTLMRRLMSNAQSRVRLLDSINDIDAVADKFGGKLTGQKLIEGAAPAASKNDLISQVLFADELDAVFGPAARTSLQGQFDQALKQGVGAVTTPGGAEAAGVGLVGKAVEKARGINEAGAFKAIKELLKEK